MFIEPHGTKRKRDPNCNLCNTKFDSFEEFYNHFGPAHNKWFCLSCHLCVDDHESHKYARNLDHEIDPDEVPFKREMTAIEGFGGRGK